MQSQITSPASASRTWEGELTGARVANEGRTETLICRPDLLPLPYLEERADFKELCLDGFEASLAHQGVEGRVGHFPADVDEDFNRADREPGSIRSLFSEFFGFESLIEQLETYQHLVRNSRALEKDPREDIPFNFLFCGPPGKSRPRPRILKRYIADLA